MIDTQTTKKFSHRPSAAEPEQTGNTITLTIEAETVCSALGVDDPNVASRLLSQLVNVLHPDPAAPVNASVVEQALAILAGIKPRDMLEAMNATMLVGAQHAALDSLRRAMHPDQTPAGRALYESLAFKAMRAFAHLLEALNSGRGKSTIQRVVVERVNVEPGGQAIVGTIGVKGGGGE